jgi:hypothetical protein
MTGRYALLSTVPAFLKSGCSSAGCQWMHHYLRWSVHNDFVFLWNLLSNPKKCEKAQGKNDPRKIQHNILSFQKKTARPTMNK